MKKLILSVTAVAGFSIASFGQGITLLDGNSPAYDTTIAGTPNTTQDLNIALLYGSSSSTVSSSVVTLLLSSSASPSTGTVGGTYAALGDISSLGYLFDNSGTEYNLPAGAYYFQVEAWTGSYQTYAAALASGTVGVYAGASPVFAETLAASPAPSGDVSAMGVINLSQVLTTIVPEPSTLAMAGVGLASMLFMRRKIS